MIAPARPADWPAVLDLLRAARLPVADLEPEHVVRFLVARERNAVVGCVAVEPYGGAGLLRSLAVAPEHRGRGLGARLAEAAEDAARARGLDVLYLLTTTAAPFFRARGYTPTDRAAVPEAVRQSSEFQGVCPASAVCLRKPEAGRASLPPGQEGPLRSRSVSRLTNKRNESFPRRRESREPEHRAARVLDSRLRGNDDAYLCRRPRTLQPYLDRRG